MSSAWHGCAVRIEWCIQWGPKAPRESMPPLETASRGTPGGGAGGTGGGGKVKREKLETALSVSVLAISVIFLCIFEFQMLVLRFSILLIVVTYFLLPTYTMHDLGPILTLKYLLWQSLCYRV